MKREPLFIRFSNGIEDAGDVVHSFLDTSDHPKSVSIAKNALNSLPDISLFRRDFKKALKEITESGISKRFVDYVDSYMKPSLLEVVDDGKGSSRLSEKRGIIIKEADTPWIEAIICYNLCLYIRAFNVHAIKCCDVCEKFFTHKGKYAKYCSDECKARKGK